VVVQDESTFPKDSMKMSASCMENIKLLLCKRQLTAAPDYQHFVRSGH